MFGGVDCRSMLVSDVVSPLECGVRRRAGSGVGQVFAALGLSLIHI